MLVHNINPVLLQLGNLQIRYYGIIYVLGFVISYFFILFLSRERKLGFSKDDASDLIFYLLLGVVLGSRLFYILFYNLSYYISNPLEMFALWHGGMSFHGGLVGSFIAVYLYSKKKKVHYYDILDIIVIPTAIALGLGRIGNFINGELYGRVTSLPWGMNFGDGLSRHPSQLYESVKNFFIFGVLWFIRNKKVPRGFLFWTFVTLYGVLRFMVEFVREPDPQLGFVFLNLSMGQVLCSVLIIVGVFFMINIKKKR